jgi:hypothetical protein
MSDNDCVLARTAERKAAEERDIELDRQNAETEASIRSIIKAFNRINLKDFGL